MALSELRGKASEAYPINRLRNLALLKARRPPLHVPMYRLSGTDYCISGMYYLVATTTALAALTAALGAFTTALLAFTTAISLQVGR